MYKCRLACVRLLLIFDLILGSREKKRRDLYTHVSHLGTV